MSGGGGGGAENVRGISELSTVFTVIFVITLLVLLAQLFYILLRRRQTTTNAVSYSPSNKQFLYFFCLRAAHNSNSNPVQAVDSSLVTVSNTNCNECPISSRMELGMGFVDVDVLTLHGVFGPPRILFTIKEEEEGEGEDEESGNTVRIMNRVVSLKQCFDDDDDREGGGTPFATPCDSPAFFTPLGSPVHVEVMGWSRDEEMGLADQ